MGREARREAPPVPSTARSVLLYVSTERRKRWRIATRLAPQAPLFFSGWGLGGGLA